MNCIIKISVRKSRIHNGNIKENILSLSNSCPSVYAYILN